LSHDPKIVSAARLGEMFSTDPLTMLDCSEIDWIIRLAAATSLARDHKEAEKNSKRGR